MSGKTQGCFAQSASMSYVYILITAHAVTEHHVVSLCVHSPSAGKSSGQSTPNSPSSSGSPTPTSPNGSPSSSSPGDSPASRQNSPSGSPPGKCLQADSRTWCHWTATHSVTLVSSALATRHSAYKSSITRTISPAELESGGRQLV